jgi:NADPH:quinone reductase-like Zn-dependent oxidoreductase
MMKAMVYRKYGSPDELHLEEIDIPTPGDHEVLIKVKAASINSWDWDLLRGEPFITRLAGGGIRQPKKIILGCDVAGIVTAVGNSVKHFKMGDAVFGDLSAGGWGCFAEYVCAKEAMLEIKSDNMTFAQAAAIPQAGVMALQGVRDYGQVVPGKKVLVNGAGGGVGTFAIQLARAAGAEVTAVDSAAKLDKMKALGAAHVIDYAQSDFTQRGECYDLILDVVGHHSLSDYRHSLAPEGNYRMIGGQQGLIFQSLLLGPLISLFGNKKMGILAHEPNKNLTMLKELFDQGTAVPIIDSTYPLSNTPEAIAYLGAGNAFGKVVVMME